MKKSKKIARRLKARQEGFVQAGKHEKKMPGSQNLKK